MNDFEREVLTSLGEIREYVRTAKREAAHARERTDQLDSRLHRVEKTQVRFTTYFTAAGAIIGSLLGIIGKYIWGQFG